MKHTLFTLARVASSLLGFAAVLPAQQCQPDWLTTFGGAPGTDVSISALEVFDDGSGPALYAAGRFLHAGGVPARRIAKWDGSRWSAVGGTGTGYLAEINCLEVFDDGNGPALYAGGDFSQVGGVQAFGIAKWDGAQWSPLGPGVGGDVHSLEVFDDGTGPALYVGGDFDVVGGLQVNRIAKWDGSTWSALGNGLPAVGSATVLDMEVYDDGSGPELYVAGSFVSVGKFIAKWDGTEWSSVGNGMKGPAGGTVFALQVYDEGNGPVLFAGGVFNEAGGASASHIARWDGNEWSALGWPGAGTNSFVYELGVFDRGSGPELVVGGSFSVTGVVLANRIATWNGTGWSRLANGIAPSAQSVVTTVAVFDDGGGPDLYAGGNFQTAGTVEARNIARWEGADWSSMGNGPAGAIRALTTFDDGSGEALYAGGEFDSVGSTAARRVARWDGSSWSTLGIGTDQPVHALATFDDGSGAELIAGGYFKAAGGQDAGHIAAWDGASWSPLGDGNELNAEVLALTVFDDGTGPALYAGGNFTAKGPIPSDSIARWDGANWSGVGGGLNGGPSYFHAVQALQVFDDGNGPALYAGGGFLLANGQVVNQIARWDGTSWSGVDGGVDHYVQSMTVFDDGNGPVLYVGGYFSNAGNVAAERVARWNGSTWSGVGGGLKGFSGGVHDFAVFDEGNGPTLFAAGSFSGPPLVPRYVARLDGNDWTALGTPSGSLMNSSVNALAVFDDGEGRGLFVGGHFTTSAAFDSYLAQWGCESPSTTTFCTAKTTLVCGPAHISSLGTPSGTATSGFVVEAQPVRGCRAGLLLYSDQPPQQAVAFGGPGDGRLCLSGAGLRRAGPIESGGTSPQQCDGRLSIDMNRFRSSSWTTPGCNPPTGQTTPAAFLGNMGTTVHAQIWGRDSTTTGQVLSNGISWVVGP